MGALFQDRLADWVSTNDLSARGSILRSEARTERVQDRRSTEQGMTEEDRYWDTADRENTARERVTKKNPTDRIQDREDKVFSLCGVRFCKKNNCSFARWKLNKSLYQIKNTLITCRVTRKKRLKYSELILSGNRPQRLIRKRGEEEEHKSNILSKNLVNRYMREREMDGCG
jgi:hypothetical protein